jgi:phosphatidylglycerol---prolipoprotein diacylglyceryl transferase
MLQELFRIPGLDMPIYGYGLMMVIGFLCAAQLAKFLAARSGLDPEVFINAGLLALVTGVIGARLSHVLENLDQYTDASRSVGANLWDAVNIRSGGLTFYGGLLLATPVLIWYGWRKRVPLRLGMDIIAPCVMLGLAFGRVGCFLNGCCYGAECNVPWAVEFPYYSNAYVDQYAKGEITPPPQLKTLDEDGQERLIPPAAAKTNPALRPIMAAQHARDVHPAQLYSAFNALLIAATLTAFFTIPHSAGRVFALMFILKGVTRFILEMLRAEPAVLGPMSFSMVVSIALVIAGIVLWFAFGSYKPYVAPPQELEQPRPASKKLAAAPA